MHDILNLILLNKVFMLFFSPFYSKIRSDLTIRSIRMYFNSNFSVI